MSVVDSGLALREAQDRFDCVIPKKNTSPRQVLRLVIWLLTGASALLFTQVSHRVLDSQQAYQARIALIASVERTSTTLSTTNTAVAAGFSRPWALVVRLRRILPELDRTGTSTVSLRRALDELDALLSAGRTRRGDSDTLLQGRLAAVRTELARVYDELLLQARAEPGSGLSLAEQLSLATVMLGLFLGAMLLLQLRLDRESREQNRMWLAPGLDRIVFQHSPAGMLLCDRDEIVQAVNPAYCRLSGFDEAELIGQHQALHQAGGWQLSDAQVMRDALYSVGCWRGRLWLRRKSGEAFSMEVVRIALLDGARQVHAFLTLSLESAAGDEAQRLMLWQAHHDTLTKLPNMNLFTERVNQCLANTNSDESEGALISIDLDGFSSLNDSLGYSVGDQILMDVSHRIALNVRDGATVARLGGDSFGVFLHPVAGTVEAAHLARELLSAISAPLAVEGRRLFVTASIGVTLFPTGQDDIGSIVQRADAARAQANSAGGAQCAFFEPAMNERAARRLELESELRDALALNQLSLHYQPIIDLGVNRVATFEALLRWEHPRLGWISPAEFIPVAEHSGLIVEIGLWVVREAMAQLDVLEGDGFSEVRIAINISTRQLREINDVSALLGELRTAQTKRLTLEITESLLVADMDLNREFLAQAKALGARIALDDFGTGFSSLSYLRDYQFDLLKIDRSFVNGLSHTSAEKDLVASIISLGQILGLAVVAEGVEEAQELDCLSDLGCELIQGYYFARPMAADQVLPYLREGELRLAS